jgi:hypothetical protein
MLSGHILVVCRNSNDGEVLAQWTSEWINNELFGSDIFISLCPSLDLAEHSLKNPLEIGELPTLIILEHWNNDPEMCEFSERLRECLPEIWVADIVSREGIIPDGDPHLVVHKPLRRDIWEENLHHIFFTDNNPISFKIAQTVEP